MKIRLIFLCSVSILFISCGVIQRNFNTQDSNESGASTGYLATSDAYVKVDYLVEIGQALVGGVGQVLHDRSQQRTECIAACQSFQTKNLKRSCTTSEQSFVYLGFNRRL